MSENRTSIQDSEMVVLQQAAKLIARSHDPAPAIQGILRLLSQLLGLNRGRVLLPDNSTHNLEITYAYGLTKKERDRGSFSIGEGVSGRVFKTGQLALIPDIDEEPNYLARTVDRATLPNEKVAFLAVPIMIEERPIGVLGVHRLRARNRSFQHDLAILQVISTFIGQALRVRDLVAERTADLMSENRLLKSRLQSDGAKYGIIGESPALQTAIQSALQVAKTSTTVLVLGESGTGKERFARMQHLASKRADGPFISINCAAIPASLIESELFGHEKGAFTGANAVKKGKIELANGGTLFLDEIGDLDLDLQAKLLKVLENSSIQRVGGTRDIEVDVRIVAATHKNLQEAVNENQFRLDLFYRLNVFPIRLPPLRSRKGDIAILAKYFLSQANEEYDRKTMLQPGCLELFDRYTWPGNIRQLENLIKRAVLLTPGTSISRELVDDILSEEEGITSPVVREPIAIEPAEKRDSKKPLSSENLRPYSRVSEDEKDEILEALEANRGNKTRAAISLGLTPRQLRYRMQKLNLI